jgi:hypothetical protein
VADLADTHAQSRNGLAHLGTAHNRELNIIAIM